MLEIVSINYQSATLFGLKRGDELIIKERCHAIFKINDSLYGYRVGLRWGIISNQGVMITDLVLKGYYEWELSPDKIDQDNNNLMYNEPYNCNFVEEYLTDFGTDNEAYIFLKDIYHRTFIIDFAGKILLHEKLDDIWKIDRINYFIVFKTGMGNLWNCRTGDYLLDKWYASSWFRQGEFSAMFVPYNGQEYRIDNENDDGFIRILAVDQDNPERVVNLK